MGWKTERWMKRSKKKDRQPQADRQKRDGCQKVERQRE